MHQVFVNTCLFFILEHVSIRSYRHQGAVHMVKLQAN